MKVSDVMTSPVATCLPETNLAQAAALMWEHDCGVLPVLAVTGELVGVVTDRDICIALGTRNIPSSDLSVRDVIQDRTLICKSSDDIHVALQTMRGGKVRRLPVVNDDGHLQGIVSIDDVVLLADSDGKMGSAISYADVVTTLRGIYERSKSLVRNSENFRPQGQQYSLASDVL
jgi:CBS domain-containing protein